MKKELSNEEIIAMYELQDIINSNFKGNKEYGFDLDVDSFFLRCRNLKTQIYGLRVQAYLCTLLKYRTTPSSDDCGDFKTRENQDVEFKCSFLDNQAKAINVKQIRNWQDLDYYYCFTVDYSDYRNIAYKCYKLTKKQMEEECTTLNAKPVHSTKKNNENNEKVELGFSIKIGSEHYNRWEEKYLNKKLDLKALSDERIKEVQVKNEYQSEIEKYKAEIERLKAQISDKSIKNTIKTEEILEEVIENIVFAPVDILSASGEPVVFHSNSSKLYFQKKKHITTAHSLYGRDLEKHNERIEAIKAIPDEWITKLFDKIKKRKFSYDWCYDIVTWKITDMKNKSIKRRVKKEEPFDMNAILKQMYSGAITQEECTELLNARMMQLYNNDKGKIDYDALDLVSDEEEFEITPIEDSLTNQLAKSAAYY